MSRISGIHIPESGASLIDNAEGLVFQRQATPATPASYNNDSYAADRWKILCESNTVNASQATSGAGGANNGITLAKATAVGRFGMIQFKEADESVPLRGKKVTFRAYVKGSASLTQIKAAIIGWSGTADSPTTSVVSAWSSSPTYIASITEYGSVTATVNSLGFTAITVTATVANNCNNLAFFIFTPNSQAIADTATFSAMTASIGTAPIPYSRKDDTTETSRCSRYYNAGSHFWAGFMNNTNLAQSMVLFKSFMRVTPTVSQTNTGNNGMSASVQNNGAFPYGFISGRSATASAGCTYSESWTANADF